MPTAVINISINKPRHTYCKAKHLIKTYKNVLMKLKSNLKNSQLVNS